MTIGRKDDSFEMFSVKTSILIFCVAVALGAQSDSCRRQNSRAPQEEGVPSPQAGTTPRAGGGGKLGQAKGNDKNSVKRGSGGEVKTLAVGEWGGQHISLTVTEKGAVIEYDCAHGTIGQRVELNADGRFDVRGTHEGETGGASTGISIADDSGTSTTAGTGANRSAARYTGRVEGDTLSLTVTLTDDGQILGTFLLTRNASPRLYKCRG